ncbi:MAG: gamma-glutamyltransferase [Betaproteobacteria bacterium]
MPPAGGTVYSSTADPQGRMVSFIGSNHTGFGSGWFTSGKIYGCSVVLRAGK